MLGPTLQIGQPERAAPTKSLPDGKKQGDTVHCKANGGSPMLESAITKKGQTTLPKPVLDTLGVQAGDRLRAP